MRLCPACLQECPLTQDLLRGHGTVTAGGVVVTAPLTLEGQGWRVVWESQSLEGMGLAVTVRRGCLGCHQLTWDIFISLLGPKAWE